MSFPLFDAPAIEASQAIGFCDNRIDRQSEKRDDDSTSRALADPAARLMPFCAGKVLMRAQGGGQSGLFALADAASLQPSVEQAVLLGRDGDAPILAAACAIDPETLPDGVTAADTRSILMQGLLPPDQIGAMAQASALLNWHASHGFCGKCGHATAFRSGGMRRLCPNCGTEHFPRTDPVVIMLTVTRDRCLMGRGRHFAPGMYSALAGFIEPGETIEAAVRRETLEEAGIRLGRVVYHASQPWPYPYSLMIGCFGEALNENIEADDAELEACRWFTRDEVFAALERRHPDGIVAPLPGAIAHHLIRFWAENP